MKKIIIKVILMLSIVAYSNNQNIVYIEDEELKIVLFDKSMVDENIEKTYSFIIPWISIKDNEKYLGLKIMTDQLFYNVILTDENNKYKLEVSMFSARDKIGFISNTFLRDRNMEVLEKILSSPKVLIKYTLVTNKKIQFVLSEKEKNNLIETIEEYKNIISSNYSRYKQLKYEEFIK